MSLPGVLHLILKLYNCALEYFNLEMNILMEL